MKRAELLRRLAASEPESSIALALVLAARPRDVKALAAGPGDRSLAALVRAEPTRWTAHVLLGDEADALALAREIDTSAATLVEGGAQAMMHVRAGLWRSVEEQVLRRLFVPEMPDDWLVPDERTRLATRFDLDRLVTLYQSYELRYGRTRRALRHLLDEAIRCHGVVVIEQEGRLVGALQLVGATPTVMYWSYLTVDPRARQRGLSWALAARALDLTRAARLGAVVTLAVSNPMTIPPWLGRMDLYSLVALAPPHRFPGERKLRRAVEKVSPTRRHRP